MLYFFIGCWTHGAGISGGIFIPCLLIGAIYGRFVATVFGYAALHMYTNNYLWFITIILNLSFLVVT